MRPSHLLQDSGRGEQPLMWNNKVELTRLDSCYRKPDLNRFQGPLFAVCEHYLIQELKAQSPTKRPNPKADLVSLCVPYSGDKEGSIPPSLAMLHPPTAQQQEASIPASSSSHPNNIIHQDGSYDERGFHCNSRCKSRCWERPVYWKGFIRSTLGWRRCRSFESEELLVHQEMVDTWHRWYERSLCVSLSHFPFINMYCVHLDVSSTFRCRKGVAILNGLSRGSKWISWLWLHKPYTMTVGTTQDWQPVRTFTSSVYTSTFDQITHEFGVSNLVATIGLSLYIMGLAVGPMLLGPLS